MAIETAAVTQCPHARTCRLYPLFRVQSMLRVWQVTYCEGDYTICERHKRSLCGQAIADNLLPNGKLLGAK